MILNGNEKIGQSIPKKHWKRAYEVWENDNILK